LTKNRPHSLAFASRASLDCRCISATNTIAGSADALPVDFELDGLSIVDIGQANINLFGLRLDSCLSLLASASTSAAHEHAEDVIHAAATSSASFESLHSVLIIGFSLILVEKDFVGSLNFFELLNLVIG
jgi:hypothetical protein